MDALRQYQAARRIASNVADLYGTYTGDYPMATDDALIALMQEVRALAHLVAESAEKDDE